MINKILSLVLVILTSAALANAQTAEVSITLNEQFFDKLLDAIFKNFNAPEFPLAASSQKSKIQSPKSLVFGFDERESKIDYRKSKIQNCKESIRLLREVDNVKTSVRFRDGRIYSPIAFSGSYNPPFIGCIDFAGWAETNIDLEYDRQNRKLVGRVRVLTVNLGGVSNLASGVLSRLVQTSIDKKINPIEIIQTDKLSFLVPVQNSGGSLKMKAVGVRHVIADGVLNVNIAYEFSKGN